MGTATNKTRFECNRPLPENRGEGFLFIPQTQSPANLNPFRHRRERYCPRDEDAPGDCTCFFSFCRSLTRVCSVVLDKDWPPETPTILALTFESEARRDRQLKLCSSRTAAPNSEPCSNSLRPFAHTRQSPVSIAPRVQ
jgi:hypothetical protein